eukprot:Opistho-2@25772
MRHHCVSCVYCDCLRHTVYCRQLLAASLRDWGAEVFECPSLNAAQAALSSGLSCPRIAVIDGDLAARKELHRVFGSRGGGSFSGGFLPVSAHVIALCAASAAHLDAQLNRRRISLDSAERAVKRALFEPPLSPGGRSTSSGVSDDSGYTVSQCAPWADAELPKPLKLGELHRHLLRVLRGEEHMCVDSDTASERTEAYIAASELRVDDCFPETNHRQRALSSRQHAAPMPASSQSGQSFGRNPHRLQLSGPGYGFDLCPHLRDVAVREASAKLASMAQSQTEDASSVRSCVADSLTFTADHASILAGHEADATVAHSGLSCLGDRNPDADRNNLSPTTDVNRPLAIPSGERWNSDDMPHKQRAATPQVLVVDDLAVNRLVLGKMLQKLGCTVAYANDGLEAVAKCGKRAQESGEFDVVFMDIQMPNCDGIEATLRIRKDEAKMCGCHVAIIAVTANMPEEQMNICLDAGMEMFLQKPVTMDILKQVLAQYA